MQHDVDSIVNQDYMLRWDKRSSIRSRPQKNIDFELPGFFFPPDKQPLLLNPVIQSLSPEIHNQILTLSFFKYIHDITKLEIKLINQACEAVVDNVFQFKFTPEQQFGAQTIIIDEFYHVYLANRLKAEIEAHDKSLPKIEAFPNSDSSHAVKTILAELPVAYHQLFTLIAVCIFETTLVRELVSFFNSPQVHPSIKYYVNDHMNDESRHYAYFYELLGYVWSQMDPISKSTIGSKLGKFIVLYLDVNSDRQFNTYLANLYIGDAEQSRNLVEQIYSGFVITPEIPMVKNVLQVLNRLQIATHPDVELGLANEGLYPAVVAA